MDQALFQRFRALAEDKAGIALREGKESLVSARVAKRLRALRLDDEEQYIRYLEADESGEELIQFLDVISTNFTSFFREPVHFDMLAEEVRRLVAAGRRRIRVWSAAASSGEEPYSIVMTVLEALEGRTDVDFRLLATDISTRVLEHARAGVYAASRLESVPRAYLHRYFTRIGPRHADDPSYAIKAEVAARVAIKRLNLARPPFPMRGPIDLIFCRNVMIYFGREVRQALIDEFERLLPAEGMLMTGHSETLAGITTVLRRTHSAVYRRPAMSGEVEG